VYLTLRDRPAAEPGTAHRARQRVAGTVLLLGLVSLLTDVSSESVNSVLPIYLTSSLGISILGYGFLDGVYQGVSALVRIPGGWIADRADHPKWVAVVGYGVSAVSRVALLPAHTFGAIASVITVDRLGKGLRTAPRDALIAEASPREAQGRAFGVHRAMDTAGALAGPLIAYFVLRAVPGGYHSVFVTSLAFAIVGLAILVLIVPDLRPRRRATTGAALTRPSLRLLADRRLLRLCGAAGLLGLVTIGDGFLYLELATRVTIAAYDFPLLLVGTNIAYLLLAIPLGRLADRVGRVQVFIGGNVALLGAYLAAGAAVTGAVIACLALLGTYYAATDGVLAAIAGQISDRAVRTSGIATAQTAVAVARFVSSVGFGALWAIVGPESAIRIAAIALALVLVPAIFMLRGLMRSDRSIT